MKKSLLAAAVLCALTSGAAMAQQAEGPWMVRARAAFLQSANGDSAGLGTTINDKWLPELDISYFFTKNVAAELILTVPQQHNVAIRTLGGHVGTLKHLPPTLTLQYHFDASGFRPYVGAGVNFTAFSDVEIPGYDVNRKSWGGAFQVGVDVPIAKNTYLNFDLKKLYIATDINTAAGAKATTFSIDPLLFGIGVGWRF